MKLDVAGSFRREDVWLLFGGRQYDTAQRIAVARTFFAGQFAGSVDYGFVAASADGGSTWKVIDRWEDHGPQAAFLSDSNRLTLVSWLDALRQGTIALDPLAAKMQTLLPGDDTKRVPYVENVTLLDLLDDRRGLLSGWIHHVGTLTFRTADGGRTWQDADPSPRSAIWRLFDGTWVGLAPPSTLQRYVGRKWETGATLPDGIAELRVDSQGALLVRQENGRVHVFDPAKRALRLLPTE